MGALEQIAELVRETSADLAADLDRMDRIDELRRERDALTDAADEHELLIVEGAKDATVHRLLAASLRQKAQVKQWSIDHMMREGAISQRRLEERDLAKRATEHSTPLQYFGRTVRSEGYCLDAPNLLPAGSCEYGDDDCETLFVREG